MGTNQIRAVSFQPVAPDPGGAHDGGHALLFTLEVGEPERLLGFLEEVVARFTHERIAGPPDAPFMLITLVGDVPAGELALAWATVTADDAPARALLGMMRQADVVHVDPEGRVVDQASLLARPDDPGARPRAGVPARP